MLVRGMYKFGVRGMYLAHGVKTLLGVEIIHTGKHMPEVTADINHRSAMDTLRAA